MNTHDHHSLLYTRLSLFYLVKLQFLSQMIAPLPSLLSTPFTPRGPGCPLAILEVLGHRRFLRFPARYAQMLCLLYNYHIPQKAYITKRPSRHSNSGTHNSPICSIKSHAIIRDLHITRKPGPKGKHRSILPWAPHLFPGWLTSWPHAPQSAACCRYSRTRCRTKR